MEEGYMSFPWEYFTPVKILVEETEQGVATIKGTLLVEGMSKNGNLYTIDEMENIAEQAKGKDIVCGTKIGINPNTGRLSNNLHDDSPKNIVGKIIDATLDKISKKITFIAEIVNTPLFPDIIKKVKAGWGVSIGGFVNKAKYVVNKANQLAMKIENMVVQHVALVEPSVVRGQDAAKVESVSVQETMIFDEPRTINVIVDSRGINSISYKE